MVKIPPLVSINLYPTLPCSPPPVGSVPLTDHVTERLMISALFPTTENSKKCIEQRRERERERNGHGDNDYEVQLLVI